MANAKDLKHKIDSLCNMQKVMRAMNMIATIKLRRMFSVQAPLRLFDATVSELGRHIAAALGSSRHPVIDGSVATRRAELVVFTADKGLCGAHNNSVQKAVESLAQECLANGIAVETTCLGLKGANFCRRKGYDVYYQSEIGDRTMDMAALRRIAADLLSRYLAGNIQRVFIVYNRFITTLHQQTVSSRLLPLPVRDGEAPQAGSAGTGPDGGVPDGGGGRHGDNPPDGLRATETTASGRPERAADYATEPVAGELAVPATELYLSYRLRAALANSLLSEHASRMTAMENATNNSEDLIGRYMTIQNRARQATITREIIEIISGKEALNG